MPVSARDDAPRVSGRRLGLAGAVAFVVFTVMLFPARLVWQWQADLVPLLSLSSVGGTVWHGEATGVFVAGVPLGTASWSWRPLALLRGQWRNRVRLELPDGEAQGDLGWTVSGAAIASDVSLRTSLSRVLQYYPGGSRALPVQLEGGVGLVLEHLVYRDGNFGRLAGVLQLGDLTVAENNVGSLLADLRDADGGVVTEFRSAGDGDPSPGIEGVASWRPSGDYRLRLSIAEPDVLGLELGGLVRGLARQADDGRWRLEWQGRL